jgi:hypothetical protein
MVCTLAGGCQPFRLPGWLLVATLVALPAQERVDLGLQSGLHHQPHADPGDVLQNRREVTVGAEQLVDLGT